jgi:hypothetical protein
VRLCKRKEHTTDARGDTFIYAAHVLDQVAEILATGFNGWIAPESHYDDANTKQAWMWKYGYGEEMLEALYAQSWSVREVQTFAERHRGTGWRFPKIFIFTHEPPSHLLGILKVNHCPWGIESELRDEVVEPPPPPDASIEISLKQIEFEVQLIRDKLTEGR